MNKADLINALAAKNEISKKDADKAVATLKAAGEEAYILGEAVNGEKGIDIL